MNFYECAVGIPAFERADLFARMLDCLKQQTYQLFQLVIVDDSETDDLETLVRRLAGEEPAGRVKYIRRQARSGCHIASAWNTIWRSADITERSVLILTNSHILMQRDWVARHLAYHAGSENRLVIGPWRDGSWEGFSTKPSWDAQGESGRFKLLRCFSDSLRKKHLRAIGGWDEDFDGEWGFEDVDLAYRLKAAGLEFTHGEAVEVVHLRHERTHALPGTGAGMRNVQILGRKHPELAYMVSAWH